MKIALPLAVALSFAIVPRAFAAPPTPEEVAQAREIYTVATTAFAAQLYPDAEQAFRDVYRLIHAPNVLYNIALTLEKQKKWGASADAYDDFVRESKPSKDRRAIEQHVVELRGRALRQLEATPPPAAVTPPPATTPGNDVMKPAAGDDSLRAIDGAAPAATVDASQESKPVYKKWWLWVAIGGAIVVAAVIAAVVVTETGGSHVGPGVMTTFPDFGPGAGATLLRF